MGWVVRSDADVRRTTMSCTCIPASKSQFHWLGYENMGEETFLVNTDMVADLTRIVAQLDKHLV